MSSIWKSTLKFEPDYSKNRLLNTQEVDFRDIFFPRQFFPLKYIFLGNLVNNNQFDQTQ